MSEKIAGHDRGKIVKHEILVGMMDVTRTGRVVGIDPGNSADRSIYTVNVGDYPVVIYFDCFYCGRVTDVKVLREGTAILENKCPVCGMDEMTSMGWYVMMMPREGLLPVVDECEI